MVNPIRDKMDTVASLDHALRRLTPSEEKIIKMRYGLGQHRERISVKEIASHFERSESFVYKRLSRARSKLNPILYILNNSGRSAQELQKVAQILQDAKRSRATAEELSHSIKTQLPELLSLSDVLPNTRVELYAFLALILTAISILITLFSNKDNSQKIINQTSNVINQVRGSEKGMSKSPTPEQHHKQKRKLRKSVKLSP